MSYKENNQICGMNQHGPFVEFSFLSPISQSERRFLIQQARDGQWVYFVGRSGRMSSAARGSFEQVASDLNRESEGVFKSDSPLIPDDLVLHRDSLTYRSKTFPLAGDQSGLSINGGPKCGTLKALVAALELMVSQAPAPKADHTAAERLLNRALETDARLAHAEEVIVAQSAEHAFIYAREIIKGRWPKGEPTIAKEEEWAFRYARDVVKGRFVEAEKGIVRDAFAALRYARDIIKAPWVEAEPVLLENLREVVVTAKTIPAAVIYAHIVLKSRWPEAEDILARGASGQLKQYYAQLFRLDQDWWQEPLRKSLAKSQSKHGKEQAGDFDFLGQIGYQTRAARAYVHARDILVGRWPAEESFILEEPTWAAYYARDILKSRWPELEEQIAHDAGRARHYAEILGVRFPKGEAAIAKDAREAMTYAREVIKGRFHECEKAVAEAGFSRDYQAIMERFGIELPEDSPVMQRRAAVVAEVLGKGRSAGPGVTVFEVTPSALNPRV